MIKRTTAYTLNLDAPTVETRWDNPLTCGDKNADVIQATLMRGSVPATLTGLSAILYGVRTDGSTAFVAGSVTNNVVTVTLDYTFYAIPGKIELLLQLAEGTTVYNTPLRITAYVKSGQTEDLVSAGEQFTLAELVAIAAACETATDDANTAAGAATTAASNVGGAIAPAYSPSSTYALGAVCTYLGTRYKCTTAITVAEAWTAGHWAAEDVQDALDAHSTRLADIASVCGVMGDKVGELESALSDLDDVVFTFEYSAIEVSPDGTVSTGRAYNLNSKTQTDTTTAAWAKYSISGQQILEVTGGSRAVVPAFALCGAYDSSDNLLQTFGTTASTNYSDYEITTPADTSYVIVNGTYYQEGDVYVLRIGVKQITRANVTNVIEKIREYTTDGVSIVYGGFLNNTTFAVSSHAGCSYIDYVLAENEYIEKIKFSGKNGSSNKNFYSCTFYDSSDNQISHYGEQNTEYTDVVLSVPTGTKRIIINGVYYNSSLFTPAQPTAKLQLYKKVDLYTDLDKTLTNQWHGKKITLLGTSVAYGSYSHTNYINEAAKILGFSVFNTGVPGMSITIDQDGAPIGSTGYSSALSLAEYSAQEITVPVDTSDSHYYCSWERIFTSNANNTDLFIFACIPNNTNFALTDWELFNKQTWSYPNSETFADHRQTFLGGLLFLMDKMYSFKSDARMCLLIDTSIGLSESSKTAIKTIAEYYNIPLIDLWGKIQTTPQMLTLLKSENGTNNHPSTYAHELMGNILAGELLSVF